MGLFDFLKKREIEIIKQLKAELDKYDSISDLDAELAQKTYEVEKAKIKLEELSVDLGNSIETYRDLRTKIDDLKLMSA